MGSPPDYRPAPFAFSFHYFEFVIGIYIVGRLLTLIKERPTEGYGVVREAQIA